MFRDCSLTHLSISMEKLSLSLCFFNGKFANLRKPWINWALSLLKRSLVIFKTMPSNEVHRMFICPTSPTCLNVLCVYRVFGAQNGYSRQATVAVFSCFFYIRYCTVVLRFTFLSTLLTRKRNTWIVLPACKETHR